jgi:hypothetical protein
MKRWMLAAALACVVPLAAARAAGPYDGSWTGAMAGTGMRCPPNTFSMWIVDNAVHGTVFGRVPFKGTVAADGSVTGAYDYPRSNLSGKITGRIVGDQFTGQLDSVYEATYSCVRSLSAKRS